VDINYEEYFTKYSTIWTEASHNGASGYYPLANKRSEKALTLIREFGTLSGTAIDFGSGPGIFANELANHGYTVTGVDFSESMIELAASYTASENNEIDFVHSNWAEYSKGIKSRSIDLITALGFIYYLDDYLKFAEEVSRMLKPGGIFVVSFRNSEFNRSEDRFAEQKQYLQQMDPMRIPEFIEFLIKAMTIKPMA
jgi:2-polyprenyl-3-methyl-5-hydroxy-6-metoxy-1,4-benzoquinol methylase